MIKKNHNESIGNRKWLGDRAFNCRATCPINWFSSFWYTCTGISFTIVIEVDNPVVTDRFCWNKPNIDGFNGDMFVLLLATMLNVESTIEKWTEKSIGWICWLPGRPGFLLYVYRKENKLPFINSSLFMLGLIPWLKFNQSPVLIITLCWDFLNEICSHKSSLAV